MQKHSSSRSTGRRVEVPLFLLVFKKPLAYAAQEARRKTGSDRQLHRVISEIQQSPASAITKIGRSLGPFDYRSRHCVSYENAHDASGHRHTGWKLNKPPEHVIIMWAGKAVPILGQGSRHEN